MLLSTSFLFISTFGLFIALLLCIRTVQFHSYMAIVQFTLSSTLVCVPLLLNSFILDLQKKGPIQNFVGG